MLSTITSTMAISTIIMMVNFTISSKKNSFLEKVSPFECGFNPKNKARLMFSLHFFTLMLMFLIFDIELGILIPMPLMISMMSSPSTIIIMLLFMLILMMGTVHEWNQSSMEWSI